MDRLSAQILERNQNNFKYRLFAAFCFGHKECSILSNELALSDTAAAVPSGQSWISDPFNERELHLKIELMPLCSSLGVMSPFIWDEESTFVLASS
jgi:hypothetical protein